jgi:Ca2+-binding RTX toxin-like protein
MVAAADPDGQLLTYSIFGVADAARFDINGNNGALTFVSAPDYEAPADANHDNIYDLTVQVSDGAGGVDAQAVAVTVTNVVSVTINGANAANTDNAMTTVAGQPFPTSEEDTIYGNGGADNVSGLGGDDAIYGGNGDGTLNGGAGNDLIDDGNGADALFGGAGGDRFVNAAISDSTFANRDLALDFGDHREAVASRDIIDLSGIDANTSTRGNKAFGFSETGAAPNSVWTVASGVTTLIFGDVNGNAAADLAIQLVGVKSIGASDFAL